MFNLVGSFFGGMLDSFSPSTKMIVAIIIVVSFGYYMGMAGVVIGVIIDALIVFPIWLTILIIMGACVYFIYGRKDQYGR
jgi:hypothetical protein